MFLENQLFCLILNLKQTIQNVQLFSGLLVYFPSKIDQVDHSQMQLLFYFKLIYKIVILERKVLLWVLKRSFYFYFLVSLFLSLKEKGIEIG
jgi:hypothetical protein